MKEFLDKWRDVAMKTPTPSLFGLVAYRSMEDRNVKPPYSSGDLSRFHVRNFLDCVKTRQKPNADIETGHLTATMCHLGNIATRLNRSLEWDARTEQVTGDEEANRWVTKTYRQPWKLDSV